MHKKEALKKDAEEIDFTIRPAAENDAGTILSLIKELAEFEQLAHEVVATEDDIRRSLFGTHPVAEALIGEYAGIAVSFALFFYNFSTFIGKPGIYLEDLYVKPEYRRLGFGRRMLVHIARLAKDRDCGRFEWSVLDWNKAAIRTYDGLNATPMKEWILYRLTGEPLDRLAAEA